MNIGIDLNKYTATVINGKDRKVTNLSKEDIKPLFKELTNGDEVLLNALRFAKSKLGSNKFLFRNIKGD